MFSCRALLLHCSPFGIHSVWLVVFVMLYQLLLKYFVLSASLCVAFFVIRVCRYTACACCLCGASLFCSILDYTPIQAHSHTTGMTHVLDSLLLVSLSVLHVAGRGMAYKIVLVCEFVYCIWTLCLRQRNLNN